jgi:hypothetical protein
MFIWETKVEQFTRIFVIISNYIYIYIYVYIQMNFEELKTLNYDSFK